MNWNYVEVGVITVCIAVMFYQRWVIMELETLQGATKRFADKLIDELLEIKTFIREDRENFLKVDALGMTRDELAAFQKQARESGGTEGAWPEDPYEAVKVILAEWHSMRRQMLDAEARATAAEWRSAQYPNLEKVNAEYVEIVAGIRDNLMTGPNAPFGMYTGRFPDFPKLALFLAENGIKALAAAAAPGDAK